MATMTRCQRAEVLKSIDVRDLFLLNSRTIIVTGATGGLGLQVVKATLEAGADVIAIDQSPSIPEGGDWEDLIATANRNGTLLQYWCCNVTVAELTRQTFEQAVSKCRYPLRGLVHCAGIGWVGDTINFKIEEARQIIDVNLMGTWICAQAAVQLIQKHNLPASFVFIASMSGYIVNKGTPTAAYSASKAGVHQLTRSLASEWGGSPNIPEIRVNSVSPGIIRTPMTADVLANGSLEEVFTENTMLKRLSEPADYRGPVIFLLSDASSYITGSDLLVDGGYTAW